MKAFIRDTHLYFDVAGSALVIEGDRLREKPVTFMVHGGPGVDHTSFKPTFSSLTDLTQLVYFDHRGQGRSGRGDKSTYTLDNNVEDMEALRQYLGLEQIIVLGASYGGMVALSYAARYPERVKALVVMATTAQADFLSTAQSKLAQIGTKSQKAIAERLWNGNFQSQEELLEYFQVLGPLYSLNYDPELSQKSWQRTIYSIDAINIAFSTFLRELDLLPELPQITAPTLVLGAAQDWICAPEYSHNIAAEIPNSQLRILENCGHLIRADQPEIMLHEIAQFLQPHLQ